MSDGAPPSGDGGRSGPQRPGGSDGRGGPRRQRGRGGPGGQGRQSGQGGRGGPGNGGAPRGGRGRDDKRRSLPGVSFTVACDEDDLVRETERRRVVELAASAAGPLSERTLRHLVERTPEGFVVDVRAHRILTQHPAPMESLWPEVRDRLTPAARAKSVLHPDEVTPTVLDAALDRFLQQIGPLVEYARLGAVTFQFPSYFTPGTRAAEYLEWLRIRCGDLPVAVEFRRREWLDTKHREDTLAFLEAQRLTYVCVDAPQGTDTSVAPVAAVTTPGLAIVRFHGRNLDAWERTVDDPVARPRSEYRRGDLEAWIPRIEKLQQAGRRVHVVMATGPTDLAGRNAALCMKVCTEDPAARPPEPPPRPDPRRRRR